MATRVFCLTLIRAYRSSSGTGFVRFCTDTMDAAMKTSGSAFERLDFDNVVLRKLPVESSEAAGVRTVRGACFSRVQPQPVAKPRVVAVSAPAVALLGLGAEELLGDPVAADYLSGSRFMPGSEPAAHCYCGHQFGHFAGQLGDGAACYLGEVKAPDDQSPDLLKDNPSKRWEIQLKGAGPTPYSRYINFIIQVWRFCMFSPCLCGVLWFPGLLQSKNMPVWKIVHTINTLTHTP